MTSSNLKERYDAYYGSPSTSDWRRLGAIDKCANIEGLCSRVEHATILEIGAGEGSILQRLGEIGFGDQLFGLEISRSGVEAISNRAIPRLVDAKLFDGYEIPYQSERFDLAVLTHVIEHVEHPRRLLHEAKRVAKRVFVEVPTEDNLTLRRDYVDDGVGHINFFSPTTIRLLLQTCGLRVVAERLSHASPAVYRMSYSQRDRLPLWGSVMFRVKDTLLKVAPALATRALTFHASFLCE